MRRLLAAALAAALAGGFAVSGCTPGGRTGPRPLGPTLGEAATEEAGIGGVIAYGPSSDQVFDLAVPDGAGPFPVVVLIHGGFWREPYRRDLMAPLAADLAARGYATANLEYGRVGGTGGWPGTLADVAAGIDHLAALDDARLDLDRVATVGHSAGGHLAVWAAVRRDLGDGAVGADPVVVPCAVVSLAGVNDLTRAAADGLGDGAPQDLLGGSPDEVPERYDVADPARHLPPAAPVLAVHARSDTTVPTGQSERFVADITRAGGRAELALVAGDHFSVLDPDDPAWARVLDHLGEHCRGAR